MQSLALPEFWLSGCIKNQGHLNRFLRAVTLYTLSRKGDLSLLALKTI